MQTSPMWKPARPTTGMNTSTPINIRMNLWVTPSRERLQRCHTSHWYVFVRPLGMWLYWKLAYQPLVCVCETTGYVAVEGYEVVYWKLATRPHQPPVCVCETTGYVVVEGYEVVYWKLATRPHQPPVCVCETTGYVVVEGYEVVYWKLATTPHQPPVCVCETTGYVVVTDCWGGTTTETGATKTTLTTVMCLWNHWVCGC